MSQEPQINGSNCLEQIHAAGTVPEAMMGFQGNPSVIPVKTYKIAVVGFKRHRHAEIADIGFYKRTGTGIRLEIAPEKSFPHCGMIGGKAFYGNIDSLLQNIRLHRVF